MAKQPEPAPPALLEATSLFQQGKYDQAADLFSTGYQSARRGERSELAARFLWGKGNCYFATRQYQKAVECYISARGSFERSGASSFVEAMNGSLASVYSQLGEYDAAIGAVRRGLDGLPAAEAKGHRPRLLALLAELYAKQGKPAEALPLFQEAILQAGRFDDPELLSNIWDKLGADLLLQKQLPSAEEALLESYRIRKLNHLPSLGSSYRNLGLLRLEQGDLRSSEALLDLALAESKTGRGRIPEWRFYQSRGSLRLAKGDTRAAYQDFRVALELVRNYRLTVPASDATRVSLEGLVGEVYASFVETGNRLSAETGIPSPSETFEAMEESRGGSLAARLGERKDFGSKVAPAYWDRLAELQAVETAALIDGRGAPAAMSRLRSSILELEAAAGGQASSVQPGLLRRVQGSLDTNTVLLSFHLAQPSSWLWAVSRSGLSLYRLPDRTAITTEARLFRKAVQARDHGAGRLGAELYRMLFGPLAPSFQGKSRWLLSLDGDLFGTPLAALVAGGSSRNPSFLIERHSLQIVSGAALWFGHSTPEKSRRGFGGSGFVGVGDAIYNTADARWAAGSPQRGPGWGSLFRPSWKVSAASPTLGLNRLAGSGAEVKACAREWRGSSLILTGRDATPEKVRRSLQTRPAVLHFAAHVVQRPELSAGAMVALSVNDAGEDRLLGPSEIGRWNAGADLVVLSGCGSGAATVLPGAGLMGMTRAWLMAGANAVVASRWSIPDDAGVFFTRFYRRLQDSGLGEPAEALRAAQIETLRSGGWRSEPAFWASYFAIGNY